MSHPPGCTLQEHAAIIGQRTSTPSSRIMPAIARFVAQTEERPSIASTGVSRHGGVREGGCGWRSVLLFVGLYSLAYLVRVQLHFFKR
jgi:hypothetical protein